MEGLRVLLEEQRKSTDSTFDSVINVLHELRLQEEAVLTVDEHRELAQLVAKCPGEAVQEAYLGFYIQYLKTCVNLSNERS